MTGFHAEGRCFRVLPLADFGIASDFEVVRIQLGITEVRGPQARNHLVVRLHTLSGEPGLANLTQIAEEFLDVPGPVPVEVEVRFSHAVIPVGRTLVVEIDLPGPRERRDDPDIEVVMTVHGHER